MEEAYKKDTLEMADLVRQNRELGDRLEQLEFAWDKQERFGAELQGRIESLQVCSFLRGCGIMMITQLCSSRFT